HLHPGDDRFPLLRLQPLERRLVALHNLPTDSLFEGRFDTLDFDASKIGGMWLSSFSPQLVSNAIEHRLAQERLQRTDTARLEVLDSLERLNQSVLDKIVRVGEVARPPGQPAAGPPLERFEMSREEAFQRLLITRAGPLDQVEG